MKRLVSTLSFGILGSFGIAHAVVAFSSFAPGDVYDVGAGYNASGPNTAFPQELAMQFTSAATGMLDTIRFAHFYNSGSASLTLSLHKDDGTDQIGVFMASWNFSDSTLSAHITTHSNTSSAIVLTNADKYWVKLSTVSDGSHSWNLADASVPTGRLAWSTDGGASYNYAPNTTISAFDVNVVPEPGSMIALGIGAAALLSRRRRKV